MAYITNADIEERLGADAYVQLTDDDGNGAADESVVDEARLGAEGEVDSYLAKRYEVPVDVAAHPALAPILATITLDLVEYRLRSRRPPAPEESEQAAERARAWLARVAEDSVELSGADRLESSNVPGPISGTMGETRILSHDELADH